MPTLSEIEVPKETRLNCFKINVSDCIALCEIVEYFDEFINNLKNFAKGFKGNMNLNHLYKHIVNGNKSSKKVRDFYVENHKVLDNICHYSSIYKFLLVYYDSQNGKFSREIMQMYEYINNNIDNKDKILFVLYKLENLGFKVINFSENKNLDDEYEYDKYNDYYYFSDGNIEIIPSIEDFEYNEAGVNTFKYKTTGANYEIEFCKVPFHNFIITLNNLVFDSCLLPNNLSYDNTIKKIIDLKKEKEETYKILSDVVGLDYNLEKIMPALEKIDEIMIDIHNFQYKRHAKEYIDVAKHAILELQWLLANYEIDLVEDGLLKKETIDEEKKKYKRRNS